ncbi:MAG TPA: c-type cytochrome [Gallionella sp.]|nr:c-type cytochrome [Gallionella sp.]
MSSEVWLLYFFANARGYSMEDLLQSGVSKTATYSYRCVEPKRSWAKIGTYAVFITAMMVASGPAHADDAGQIVSTLCAACHGVDGKSTAPMFPNLAGQNSVYLKKQLEDFINGRRMNDLMSPAVAALKPKDVDALAAYYSTRKLVNTNNSSVPDPNLSPLIEAGKAFFRNGNPDTGVPGCTTCHREDNGGDKSYPKLFGQDALYTAKQLADLKAGVRTNDNYRLMRKTVTRITAEEMRAVAEYLAVAGR